MSRDNPRHCPHCKANVEDCEEHHAGRRSFPGFGPGVCPVVTELEALRAENERLARERDGLLAANRVVSTDNLKLAKLLAAAKGHDYESGE
jgi:hypothetical protein